MLKEIKENWRDLFATAPQTLDRVKAVDTAVTAFNVNVDAVLKISGQRLSELVKSAGMSLAELQDIRQAKLLESQDVLKGIFKCFSAGIAEEWLTEDKVIYNWMIEHLGYDRLQMGGQGGIVANVLGIIGVKKVIAHTNSHPKEQAEQFLKLDNIVSFDENGREKPSYQINRSQDTPLIHWIIEFDKGDKAVIDGQTFTCPKSNRFIATYDPLNLKLVMDQHFVAATNSIKADYVVLSGMHALTANNNGVALVEKVLPIINAWHKYGAIVHLEIASTQDIEVRKAILQKLATNCDSTGINERELIDILEVVGEEKLARQCQENCHAENLFRALLKVKEILKTPRIQLHFFGLYLTVQNKSFRITPEQNRNGMILASTIAAGKAGTGDINHKENLLWALGKDVSDVGLEELKTISDIIEDENLLKTGISQYAGFDIIAVPTILVEKPKTLVGMGDTISSISLIGAR
ncbi:MAG: ADP-dependent glucokinase/phosphofructokinase [Alphaproteobacteria bacterium]|nr:ADP-dependent glucokinase/phosphofructokinase [Alphaproteobacteria bacterium]